jgi:tripartite-type tricarboxylate transporter receptor subunit TctC
MKLPRRNFLHLAAGAASIAAVSPIAAAQAYPSRPVRIIASAAAGTARDVHGRLHGQWLSERLGQPFIVENRPGAASTIGAAEAIRSRPDGYTLFLLPISLAVTANFYSKLPYNVVHDTSPIALLYQANYVMVVNPSFPVKSVPEFK